MYIMHMVWHFCNNTSILKSKTNDSFRLHYHLQYGPFSLKKVMKLFMQHLFFLKTVLFLQKLLNSLDLLF